MSAAKELTTLEPTETTAIISVIERAAINPEVDINKMERLLDMQERVLDKNAKAAFLGAMSELQAAMPNISKTGEISVNGNVRSRYAKFEDILSATRNLLQEHGFSVSFKSNFTEGQLEITGTLSHRQGHQESTTMRLPFDDSGAKNKVQQIGSSVSYGKRYVYCMLLNINITDADDDGHGADPSNSPERIVERMISHNECLRENIASILCVKESLLNGDYSGAKEAWNELQEIEQRTLWLATTKGGIFTTEERAKMKSNEWSAA